jgi:hypothetical protein
MLARNKILAAAISNILVKSSVLMGTTLEGN